MPTEERRGLLYVGLAALLFSTSPVFIRWADPMSPFFKTWGRMLVGAIAVGYVAWYTRRRAPLTARNVETAPGHARPALRFLMYGAIAAIHFFCALASLNFTTPAHSLSIIYTAPLFVTLLSAWLLKEPIRPRQWAGVGVAVLGVSILAGLEPRFSWGMALGDGLALVSAIAFGFYSVAGRYERARYPLLMYASRVYAVAALWLIIPALLSLPSMPAEAWGWRQIGSVVALGLGPLALGHTLYNAALRKVHATYVNIIASQEVTGGIILSWLLLAEVPSPNSIIGAAVTLVGIGLVLR